jgi:hypothetical protein
LTVDDVQEKAQYHSACITNYLLKWKKEYSADNYSTIKNESEHDIALKQFLNILHHDLFENKKAFTMSSLLDKFCSLLQEGLSTSYLMVCGTGQKLSHFRVRSTDGEG